MTPLGGGGRIPVAVRGLAVREVVAHLTMSPLGRPGTRWSGPTTL